MTKRQVAGKVDVDLEDVDVGVPAIQVLFHCSPNYEDHPSLAPYREYYGDLAFAKLQEALLIPGPDEDTRFLVP